MKYRIALLAVLWLASAATAQETRYVRFIAPGPTSYVTNINAFVILRTDFAVGSNELATVLGPDNTSGLAFHTDQPACDGGINCGRAILGPATLYHYFGNQTVGDTNVQAFPIYVATLEIRQVNQPQAQPSAVPSVLLPSGQAAKVALESSIDLKTWRETWPGFFPVTDTNRFFRLRVDALAR